MPRLVLRLKVRVTPGVGYTPLTNEKVFTFLTNYTEVSSDLWTNDHLRESK